MKAFPVLVVFLLVSAFSLIQQVLSVWLADHCSHTQGIFVMRKLLAEMTVLKGQTREFLK